MDEEDKREITAAIAAGVAASVLKKQDAANEVSFAKLEMRVEQLEKEAKVLWDWKKENEPVLIWARNYMETYRGTLRMVYGAGAITIIGLLIQVYYTLGKGK